MNIKKNALSLFSIEEIREEVESRGFCLLPKRKKTVIVSCSCGKTPDCWMKQGQYYLECSQCRNKTSLQDKKRAAILEWNQMFSKGDK